jgi:hypothetical protein
LPYRETSLEAIGNVFSSRGSTYGDRLKAEAVSEDAATPEDVWRSWCHQVTTFFEAEVYYEAVMEAVTESIRFLGSRDFNSSFKGYTYMKFTFFKGSP